MIVEPLYFHDRTLGCLLMEMGPREGIVYESLAEQVSSALEGARLVARLVEEATRRQVAERERLEKEMEIATRIQTSILPRDVTVPGLEIAATMRTATEVGGDYYDVIPVEGGCWMGIGDVAGHGLGTGLVMLMMQSGIGALCRKLPDASPRELLLALNAMLVDNVRDAARPARARDADVAPLPAGRSDRLRRRARGDPDSGRRPDAASGSPHPVPGSAPSATSRRGPSRAR